VSDAVQVMARLDELARELDGRSRELADTERGMEAVQAQYEEVVGDWEAALWEESQLGDTRWPPERLRERMAHRAMDPKLLGAYNAGVAKRKRLERRIGALKVQVDAQRSILSALKEEAAATR
jgi:hypothetical protein